MGYLTKYGTLWGMVPQTTGNIFWVSPSATYTVENRTYSSSDQNDGLSPERALLTAAQAVSNATANNGDCIMFLTGAHSWSSTLAISKAGLTFIGTHPYPRLAPSQTNSPVAPKVSWATTSTGNIATVTAADTTFIGIEFIPTTAKNAVGFSAAATNLAVVDCKVTQSAAASTSTKGFVATGAADNVTFVNCYFYNPIGAQGPALDLTAVTNFLVDMSLVKVTVGSWAVAVQLGAGTTGGFRANSFQCSGTAMTIGVDGTGVAANKAIFFTDNRVGVSPGAGILKNFTNAFCEIGVNYLETVGAGTGGTLVTTVV